MIYPLAQPAASNESSAKPATFGAATSLYVNSATDTGATDCTVATNTDCGIDDAITAFDDDTTSGADADTIVFTPSIATFTVGTPTAIDNTTPGVTLAIDGNGQSATAVSGNNANSVFDILGGTVTISGLTIENGIESQGSYGGGISNNAGSTLTVTDSTVSDNSGAVGGGIYNVGTSLTVTDSTLSGNSGGNGAGIFSAPGGTSAVTSLTVTDSTVSDNSGGNGAGILNDDGSTATVTGSTLSGNSGSAAIGYEATLTVTGSTLSGNSGNQNSGGGITNESGATATVTDSTLSGNTNGGYGAGILNESGGALSVVHSTLSGNSSIGDGGGGGIDTTGAASLVATIVAGNSGGNCAVSDGSGGRPGTITDGGYNLDDDGSCGFSSANGSFSDTPAELAVAGLQNNGGPTQTIALAPDSPAIDAVTDAADCTGTDQRGVPWPNPCDIGATHATAAATVPDAPTSLMAMKGNSQVTLSWTAPLSHGGSAILGYDILEGTTPDGESTTPVVTGASGTSYTVTGLTNGTTDDFTVEAVNALGNFGRLQ